MRSHKIGGKGDFNVPRKEDEKQKRRQWNAKKIRIWIDNSSNEEGIRALTHKKIFVESGIFSEAKKVGSRHLLSYQEDTLYYI